MNTVQPSDLITEGVPEIPLATADQLQPGRIVTGVGAQHAWMILDRQAGDEAGWIRLRQMMRGVRSHNHQWTPRGEGARDCGACSLRLQRVSDLLPVTTPRARVIIPPPGVLNALDRYTLYATSTGQLVTNSGMRTARIWSHGLPIIPFLRPVWSLPDALRACLAGIGEDAGVTIQPLDVEPAEQDNEEEG